MKEVIEWHVASHRIVRKGSGWFRAPQYEVSTQWQTKLKSGYEVQDMWKHKTFKDINKALEYYKSIEEPESSREELLKAGN